MYLKIVVVHYSWLGTTWGTGTTLTYNYDTTANQNLGSLNDTWSFKVDNIRNSIISTFKSQDRIKIYYCINGDSISTSNLIMDGLVKSVQEDLADSKVLRVEGKSFGEVATNALVFTERGAQNNLNVMQFIAQAVNSVQLFDSNFNILGVTAPSTKRDGSAFPVINSGGKITEFNVSLASVLDKYLQDKYTGDGRYYWYINNARYLVIAPRLGSTVKAVLTEGVDYKTARYRINSDDVRNYIVVKCGSDAYGRKITTKYDDVVSRAKHGFKYYLLIKESIADDLIERNSGSADSKFPASYPYVTSWGETASSDDDYNDKLRAQVKSIGKAEGKAFAALHNKGLVQIDISLKPTNSYAIGDYLQITAPSYNLSLKEMRVKSVNYTEDDVDLTLVEEVTL
jgi:hypothetical protein